MLEQSLSTPENILSRSNDSLDPGPIKRALSVLYPLLERSAHAPDGEKRRMSPDMGAFLLRKECVDVRPHAGVGLVALLPGWRMNYLIRSDNSSRRIRNGAVPAFV